MEEKLNSTLYLLNNVDLDPDYNYTIDFNSLEDQNTYFDSKIVNVLDYNTGYSYIRATKTIKVQVNIDDLEGINYLYYINKNKRYYAFITSKEYVSQTCTALQFKIDVMQTFMGNYALEECFVEREHQDRYENDGQQTLITKFNLNAENIEIGNTYNLARKFEAQQSGGVPTAFSGYQLYWLIISATEPIEAKSIQIGARDSYATAPYTKCSYVTGLPTNVFTYVMPMYNTKSDGVIGAPSFMLKNMSGTTDDKFCASMSSTLAMEDLAKDPKIINICFSRYAPVQYNVEEEGTNSWGGKIYKMYINPTDPRGEDTGYNRFTLTSYKFTDNAMQYGMYRVLDTTGNIAKPISIERPTGVRVHEISKSILDINAEKNILLEPKLLISPYRFYNCRFGVNEAKYSEEQFYQRSDWLIFDYRATFGSKAGLVIAPWRYNKKYKFDVDTKYTDLAKAMRIDGATHELPLVTDAWKNYYNTHKASITTGLVTGAIQTGVGIGLGVLTGGMGLAVAGTQALGFAGNIANQLATYKDIQSQPDTLRNNATDSIQEFTLEDGYLIINEYELPDSILNRVFEYFYHYGYSCKDFKQPNIRSRYYFNYIKTIGANINTNIDSEYRAELRNIFDNGVTIWHYRDSSTFKGVNNYKYENPEVSLLDDTNTGSGSESNKGWGNEQWTGGNNDDKSQFV